MSPKGLKYILHLIGRKLFGKEPVSEVGYDQTLSKKRRRNCVLKGVTSLSSNPPEIGDWVEAPYQIKFEFSSDEREFRGSVLNFQRIDPSEDVCCLRKCCRKCFCTSESVSLDSVCDETSESSLGGDSECRRKSGCGDESGTPGGARRSVEDFIRIHSENFLGDRSFGSTGCEQNCEASSEHFGPDCDYDILLSKSSYNVLEPSYENLKLVENFYETPSNISVPAKSGTCRQNCAAKKIKDLVQSNRTYDEVIESLKIFHSSSDAGKSDPGASCKCPFEKGDNDINYYLENCKFYERDAGNDVESVSFQY